MKISQDMKRKFALVNALSKTEKPSLQDLHKATNIPESTIKRQLSALRDEFGMNILFVRESTGERGATGYYMLTDWDLRQVFVLEPVRKTVRCHRAAH